jgi:hypothetical protein
MKWNVYYISSPKILTCKVCGNKEFIKGYCKLCNVKFGYTGVKEIDIYNECHKKIEYINQLGYYVEVDEMYASLKATLKDNSNFISVEYNPFNSIENVLKSVSNLLSLLLTRKFSEDFKK